MQKLLFSILLIALICTACKRDSKTAGSTAATLTASPELLGGHWIAMDFCSRANQYGSVLQAMNNAHLPYAYAMTFNPGQPDSVTCYNGFETWNLPVKYNADTLELVGARQGKSVYLVYDSQQEKDLTMFDATTGRVQMDKFIKSRSEEAKDGYSAFLTALNHNVLGGLFTPVGKGASGDVQFSPGGFIQGLKDYNRYELCTAGDCFVAGQDVDVVTFYNSKVENSNRFMGYRFSAQNDTLSIFNLASTNPDEKGAYKINGVAYKLVRKKPQ
ncbi:MAG: hypothetical protein DYG98_01990 [Haliscomenobacteraceae bacterium CHB4]|nr:hypothetical protein [Saprospiraceae bacterium]MCE7921802.1 hypothetical protein [Haliscomenobacteraceae bacterium CHB4]